MNVTKVTGEKKHHQVRIYTLSTCGWCKKTKELLQALAIDFEYIDVDLLSDADLDAVIEEVKQHNPRLSYPTIVVDNGKHVIIGFKEDDIREALK